MSFDWIRNPDLPVSDYCQFLRKHDWLPTTLGPMEGWPPLLRQYVCQIVLNPAPRIVCWGEELALVYNEAALPLVSVMGKHPEQLGQPTFLFWGELVEQGVRIMFDEVMIHGRAVLLENHYFALQRSQLSAGGGSPVSAFSQSHETHNLRTKEGYYTMNLLPIFSATGGVAGVLYEGTETTLHVIAERRLATILRIEDGSPEVTTLKDVWKIVLDGLVQNVQDIPFAFLYSGMDDPTVESEAQRLSLEGSIGLSMDHPLAQLDSQSTNLAAFIEQACNSGKPMMVKCSDLKWQPEPTTSSCQNNQLHRGSGVSDSEPNQEAKSKYSSESPASLPLSPSRPDSSEDSTLRHCTITIPNRGFGSQIENALILPILRLGGSKPSGVLVLGMNPHRSYDDDYQKWIRQLTEVLLRTVESISVPEELRRQQQAIQQMVREHARITSHLIGRKREEELAGATLKRLADMAPVGMAMFTPDGKQIWVNQGYADHVRLPRDDVDMKTIKSNIHPDDQNIVDDAKEGRALPLNEMRILRGEPDPNFEPLPGDDGYDWIMAAPQVLLDDSGAVEAIFGWTLDITHKKRAERLQTQRLQDQAQRLQDVLEAKRQSENFIDMTSHVLRVEMRNPLSAIIQSAQSIVSIIVGSFQKNDDDHKAILDAAEIINLCAQHQKRIVDDLLTLSKLDAKLLLISPEHVDPISVLHRLVRMYEGELQNSGIKTELVVDQTLSDMAIDEVTIDPSRLLQVLINIFTNALKFTKNSSLRKITLTLSASYSRPTVGPYGESYVPFRPHPTRDQEGGQGEPSAVESAMDIVYLQFAIEDTGQGLSPEEMGALFQRFSQASPKTYGKYGGSGLGLFISRELIELQGGQIGVHSVQGQGTTFFCYIRAQRYRPRPERPDGNRRPSFEFDIAQDFKRHKFDVHHLGEASPPATPNSQGMSVSSTMHTPLEQSPASKELGVIHVLIVEDNKINQKVLSQQLKRQGCITHTADHGGQALEFLLRSTFAIPQQFFHDTEGYMECSVVLLDIEMPVMDGLTAVRRIREMEREGKLRSHVPIIAVTANARPEHVTGALEAGMDAVCTKPFGISDIMKKMRFWIEEARARMAVEVDREEFAGE